MGGIVGYAAPIEAVRKYEMSALMDDLYALEKSGLSNDQCNLVKAALTSVCNVASGIPDGSFWSGTILGNAEKVFDAYDRWNGIDGYDSEARRQRRSALRKLRKSRQRLARRIHLNQYVLQNELDKQLVGDMYGAFGKIVEAAPDLFGQLAKAIASRPV